MLNEDQIKELQNFFVENYENISKAKEQINQSFVMYNINFKYDYDTFCQDFLKNLIEYGITYDKLSDIMVVAFVVSKMILNRIPEDKSEEIKNSDEFKEIKKRFNL